MSLDGLTKRAFITPKKFIQSVEGYPQASQHIWKNMREFQLTIRGRWWRGSGGSHRVTHAGCGKALLTAFLRNNQERLLTISTSYTLFLLELDIGKGMSKNGQNEQTKKDSLNLFFIF